MKKLILGLLATLALGSSAESQQQTLPASTVVGRLGIGPGPAQAIPFSTLGGILFGSGSGIFGLTLSGDTNYTMVTTDRTVLINAALTAPRTVTLFAAASLATGQQICVADAFGGVTSTNTLTVSRAGSDTVNGGTSAVFRSAFNGSCFISDGFSKWTAIDFLGDPVTVNKGGTGAATLTNHGVVLGQGTAAVAVTAAGAAGQCLVGAGAAADPVFSGCIKITNTQTFLASGTYTPTSGMVYVDAHCIGGGGAGGGTLATSATQANAGGGGAAGGYARGVFTAATIGASKTVTIGAAGAAVSGANGGNGGDTSLGGTLLVATGGQGGPAGILSTTSSIAGGANGGTGSTSGTAGSGITATGQTGYDGWSLLPTNGNLAAGGAGGSSIYAGGGTPAMVGGTAKLPGVNAVGFGNAGAGGAATQSQTAGIGGNGAAGVCIMVEYIQ